jgi:hypothetical protein
VGDLPVHPLAERVVGGVGTWMTYLSIVLLSRYDVPCTYMDDLPVHPLVEFAVGGKVNWVYLGDVPCGVGTWITYLSILLLSVSKVV